MSRTEHCANRDERDILTLVGWTLGAGKV